MHTLPRCVAKFVYPLFASVAGGPRGSKAGPVCLQADPYGNTLEIVSPDNCGIRYRFQEGVEPAKAGPPVHFTLELLKELGAKVPHYESVLFHDVKDGDTELHCEWVEAGIPQEHKVRLDLPRKDFRMPDEQPQNWSKASEGLLDELLTAKQFCATDNPRYAITAVSMNGADQSIVATDGRRLYEHRGMQFPWQGQVLANLPKVLAHAEIKKSVQKYGMELALDQTVLEHQWLLLKTGQWTIGMHKPEGRFPRYQDVIGKNLPYTVQFAEHDAVCLMQCIDALPNYMKDGEPLNSVCLHFQPVPTVGTQRSVSIRGFSQSHETTVYLDKTTYDGVSCFTYLNRKFLKEALTLGFRTMKFGPVKVDELYLAPLNFVDANRTMLAMVLEVGKYDSKGEGRVCKAAYTTDMNPYNVPGKGRCGR